MRGNAYQWSLIFLGAVATLFFGVFLYREIFPEYRIYQDDYIDLEEFRSTYTGQPPPGFKVGVKQLVMEREDKGPPIIDRCTSCHVAVQFSHFSPTKIARDINGNILYDAEGKPIQIPNEDYVWSRLGQKIAELKGSGRPSDLAKAEEYEALKTAEVGEYVYDVTKVLKMHPLMGRETRPFEYHPLEEYGCTTCHNGNGRGLVTDRAHGPVFDGQYEAEYRGYVPKFTEADPDNDPAFARMFNSKPGHRLLFQVNPIYVGALIEAKCVQCHLSSQGLMQGASQAANIVAVRKQTELALLEQALQNEKLAVLSLITLINHLEKEGFDKTWLKLKKEEEDYSLPTEQLEAIAAQIKFFAHYQKNPQELPKILHQNLLKEIGSEQLLKELLDQMKVSKNPKETLNAFLAAKRADSQATGSLFLKMAAIDYQKEINRHISDVETSFVKSVDDQGLMTNIVTDVDKLTSHFHHGQQLYLSQACYACHRIAGLARGGVGPELTQSGKSYPWYIKESIVWPQADLPTSTMPNMRLDHEELQDLTTFLLGQTGSNKATAETAYKLGIQEWEAGKKLPWEKPVSPSQIHDVHFGMTVFATQGCAACHRLKGFEADVGYSIEKGKPTFDQLYAEKQWFTALFPETIEGSQIVKKLEANSAEIDKRINPNIRQGSILDEIDAKYPGIIESLYSPFKFAMRAKNHEIKALLADAKTPEDKARIESSHAAWQERVHRVLFMFIQEYGLGRLIGPRPNWSGVYRSDEWLMEHFRNPQAHIPRSIMPVLPFDDTKFYALTYMLNILGKKNRDQVLAIWEHKGFNPEQAVTIHCTQCHGDYLLGNGPVATWIYPVPKNLRKADFLSNLTRERAINSITHGVKGTPMPPWGETHKDKPMADDIPVLNTEQIHAIVDWLFSQLPGSQGIRSNNGVPKWQYTPEDVLKELKDEGNQKKFEQKVPSPHAKIGEYHFLETGEGLWASLGPPTLNKTKDLDVIDVFDQVPNPLGPDKYSYYIKKEYYTAQNLASGEAFFNENCAVCHGKDADGSGIRAAAMQDAKPRMLTNLDWINTRDDLRLLRSIKFGVPGTAMTPWGDLTSSLQRLQLVMYIRSLSQASNFREELNTALYKTFENARLNVERARIQEYLHIDPLKEAYEAAQKKHQDLIDQLSMGQVKTQDVVEAYQKELQLQMQVDNTLNIDELFVKLRKDIDQDRLLYQGMGIGLIGIQPDGDAFARFLKIIDLLHGYYTLKDGVLNLQLDHARIAQIKESQTYILAFIADKIAHMKREQSILQGKIQSSERDHSLSVLTADLSNYEKLQKTLISGFEESSRSLEEQKTLIDQIHTS